MARTLTIVVETTKEFADGVGTKNPFSIGVRVPDNELAIELLKITGPLAVTSANRSGENDVIVILKQKKYLVQMLQNILKEPLFTEVDQLL